MLQQTQVRGIGNHAPIVFELMIDAIRIGYDSMFSPSSFGQGNRPSSEIEGDYAQGLNRAVLLLGHTVLDSMVGKVSHCPYCFILAQTSDLRHQEYGCILGA